jgi:hypothetical protein
MTAEHAEVRRGNAEELIEGSAAGFHPDRITLRLEHAFAVDGSDEGVSSWPEAC